MGQGASEHRPPRLALGPLEDRLEAAGLFHPSCHRRGDTCREGKCLEQDHRVGLGRGGTRTGVQTPGRNLRLNPCAGGARVRPLCSSSPCARPPVPPLPHCSWPSWPQSWPRLLCLHRKLYFAQSHKPPFHGRVCAAPPGCLLGSSPDGPTKGFFYVPSEKGTRGEAAAGPWEAGPRLPIQL